MSRNAASLHRWGLAALLVLSGLACSSSSTKIGGGGAAGAGAGPGGAGGTTNIVPDAAQTVSDGGTADAVPDAEPTLPPDYAAPPQPEVSCTGTQDGAVECDLPTSTCAVSVACDAGLSSCLPWSPWIVFYQNGRCVAGRCVWDEGYFECSGNKLCAAGGCMSILMTA